MAFNIRKWLLYPSIALLLLPLVSSHLQSPPETIVIKKKAIQNRNHTKDPTVAANEDKGNNSINKNTENKFNEFEFYTKIHDSSFPVKEAGEWVYKPGIQAIHPSQDHLMCLDQERQGNCHDEDAWKKTNDTAKHTRHNSMMKNAIENSPGILSANDPWVWQSQLPQYRVLSNEDPAKYKKQVQEATRNSKFYLVGDSLTRQWAQAMKCEFIHVLGMSSEEANEKVIYVQQHTEISLNVDKKFFINATERDYAVFNLGHHVGNKLGKNWTESYRAILNSTLLFPFGRIPDSNIFFRTTSVRHFLKGAGDWNTNSSKSGSVEPQMDAKWSMYGGNSPEQPTQNLVAFQVFLRQNRSIRRVQILDTSPMMLARGDATFDGCHFCLPGPADYWSRMFYYRLLQKQQHD